MVKSEQNEFKKLIKEGTLDALQSKDGQTAITEAMRSEAGQTAIVDAMNSQDGQNAIKRGSLSALKSKEGQDILIQSFADSFHDVVMPALEDMSEDINELKIDIKYVKDNHGVKIQRLERKAGVVS